MVTAFRAGKVHGNDLDGLLWCCEVIPGAPAAPHAVVVDAAAVAEGAWRRSSSRAAIIAQGGDAPPAAGM
eukprot:1508756-Pleurochrysis_carterae.AAC.2